MDSAAGPITIMLVDEDPDDLLHGLDLLVRLYPHATIVTFSSVRLAIDYLSHPEKNGFLSGPFFAFVGVEIEGSRGVKLLKALQVNRCDAPVSIALLTRSHVPEPARIVGVDAYLTKPLEGPPLATFLNEAVTP